MLLDGVYPGERLKRFFPQRGVDPHSDICRNFFYYVTRPWASDGHTWKCGHELRGEREQVWPFICFIVFWPSCGKY